MRPHGFRSSGMLRFKALDGRWPFFVQNASGKSINPIPVQVSCSKARGSLLTVGFRSAVGAKPSAWSCRDICKDSIGVKKRRCIFA